MNYEDGTWVDRAFMFLEDGRRNYALAGHYVQQSEREFAVSSIGKPKSSQHFREVANVAAQLAQSCMSAAQACVSLHLVGYVEPKKEEPSISKVEEVSQDETAPTEPIRLVTTDN